MNHPSGNTAGHAAAGQAGRRLPLTALALERGLTPPLAGIELVGSAKDVRLNFVAPHSMLSLTDRMPRWAAALGRSQLTARPEIGAACIGCCR